jgi:hypothetical protein
MVQVNRGIDMGFVSTLKVEELGMLRGIVRKVHFAEAVQKHGSSFITDRDCDRLIESMGPEVVERAIKFGVDRGLRD